MGKDGKGGKVKPEAEADPILTCTEVRVPRYAQVCQKWDMPVCPRNRTQCARKATHQVLATALRFLKLSNLGPVTLDVSSHETSPL